MNISGAVDRILRILPTLVGNGEDHAVPMAVMIIASIYACDGCGGH